MTWLVVAAGVCLGAEFLQSLDGGARLGSTPVEWFAGMDGRHYRGIVANGYSYERGTRSNVAFFPLYPMLTRGVATATGMSVDWALLVVSQLSLLGAFAILSVYARDRLVDAPPEAVDYTLLALGFFPAGVFFRFAYSESVFLLLAVLAMFGMRRNWPLMVCAAVVGLATAARPVGVTLLLPLAMHVWSRPAKSWTRLGRLAGYLPLGCWGLAGYMLYLTFAFGDPLAFVEAQGNWRLRPETSGTVKLWNLATLEPIWSVYDPRSPVYWSAWDRHDAPWFSLLFANPLYFVGALALTAIGKRRGWLNWPETALACGLLLIPYFTRGLEMGMGSMGRFVSVAFPIYLVLGRLLAGLPSAVGGALVALSAVLLAVYSALAAAGYAIF